MDFSSFMDSIKDTDLTAFIDSIKEISSDDDDDSTNPLSEQLMNLSINPTTGIDRISNLPDSLLHHILSFLTTKDAATSSVLSKRWLHLWTWLPNLQLDQWEMKYEDYASFESTAFKIFRSRRSSFITKFSLSCRFESGTDFDSISLFQLLSAVVERNVKELDFYVENYCYDPFMFNLGILSCKTLVVLKLSGLFVLRFGSSVKLPSVKVLHLINLSYEDDDTIQSLFSGCPVLDDLYIKRGGLVRPYVTNYRVSSPTLTSLVWEDVADPYLEFICLDVPAIKYLTIDFGGHPAILVLKNTNNVERANISIQNLNIEMDWRSVMQMFQPLCGVLNLNLSINGSPNKESEYHIPSFHAFPRFENLVELALSSYCFTWRLILHMLHNSPRLQRLTFSKGTPMSVFSFFPSGISQEHEENICECCWMPPQRFPKYLDSQLTTFKFEGLEGTKLEMKLIQYVLKNSKVLRDVTIECPLWMELEQQSRILDELSSFERGSTTCQLKFEK